MGGGITGLVYRCPTPMDGGGWLQASGNLDGHLTPSGKNDCPPPPPVSEKVSKVDIYVFLFIIAICTGDILEWYKVRGDTKYYGKPGVSSK